jgi:hypothetical protein
LNFLWLLSLVQDKESNIAFGRTKEPIPRSGRARRRQMNNLILIKQEKPVNKIEYTNYPQTQTANPYKPLFREGSY